MISAQCAGWLISLHCRDGTSCARKLSVGKKITRLNDVTIFSILFMTHIQKFIVNIFSFIYNTHIERMHFLYKKYKEFHLADSADSAKTVPLTTEAFWPFPLATRILDLLGEREESIKQWPRAITGPCGKRNFLASRENK